MKREMRTVPLTQPFNAGWFALPCCVKCSDTVVFTPARRKTLHEAHVIAYECACRCVPCLRARAYVSGLGCGPRVTEAALREVVYFEPEPWVWRDRLPRGHLLPVDVPHHLPHGARPRAPLGSNCVVAAYARPRAIECAQFPMSLQAPEWARTRVNWFCGLSKRTSSACPPS